jgi:hypothetical protein
MLRTVTACSIRPIIAWVRAGLAACARAALAWSAASLVGTSDTSGAQLVSRQEAKLEPPDAEPPGATMARE